MSVVLPCYDLASFKHICVVNTNYYTRHNQTHLKKAAHTEKESFPLKSREQQN